MTPFITPRIGTRYSKLRAKQAKRGGSKTSPHFAATGISLSFSESYGCSLLGGESATDSRHVSTQHSGTSEANRIICNCVTCGRVRSIESGRGGQCADCWTEEVAR